MLSFACEIQDLSRGKRREWAGPTVPRPSPEAAWTQPHGGGGGTVRAWLCCLAAAWPTASLPEGFLHQYLLTNIPETHWKSQGFTQPRLFGFAFWCSIVACTTFCCWPVWASSSS